MGLNLGKKQLKKTIHDKLVANKSASKKMNRTAIISLIVTGWRKYMGFDKSNTHYVSWRMEDGYPPIEGKWKKGQ